MIEPIHTTGLVTLVSKDDQVDQTTYGRKAKLDLATAAGLPAGTPLSGELLRLLLLSREGGTGTVQKPAGTLFLFTAEPDVSPGDQALDDGDSWAGAWAAVSVATTDWQGDDSGALAIILADPIPFHAISALWAAWLHGDATTLNIEEGDEETIHINAWFRRES
ncbi:MAG: hypothetical protein RBU35_14365 [Anaerolineae bacterium]|jgi:hypothetical protein|nr:hypothetical protein [Anaerolineae bacterium]